MEEEEELKDEDGEEHLKAYQQGLQFQFARNPLLY